MPASPKVNTDGSEEDYEATEAASTLQRACEIRADKGLMTRAHKCMMRKMAGMKAAMEGMKATARKSPTKYDSMGDAIMK